MRRCKALDPAEPRWPTLLGQHVWRHGYYAPTADGRRRSAAEALAELECAWRLSAGAVGRYGLLDELATVAFEAGEEPKARGYAEELLAGAGRPEFARYAGGAVHYGNLILGRLALAGGDVEAAKRHLVEAGKTEGSAPLRSFGPNMQLAKELLERGERAAVLEYLRLCSVFWQTDDQRVDVWIRAVERGGTPDWGANLVY
ncbi:MAG: hypothetical protein ACRC33_26950 [Gemmataceae bacterium]